MQTEHHDRIEVGRQIKRLRQSQSITVHELAKRSTISAGYLSEVERGIPAVSLDKLRQIAEGLGVQIDTLLGETREPSATNDAVQIPAALSAAAEVLNLSYRATLTLLQGRQSLMARRSRGEHAEWGVDDWLKFYEQVKDYLPEC